MVDDEPTLGSSAPTNEDDPTLETSGEEETRETSQETTPGDKPPQATVRESRLERMTTARRERRRRAMNRFWVASVPVFILLAVAVVLLTLYGGQGDDGHAVDSTDVAPRTAAAGSAVLLVEEEGSLSAAVLLQPWDTGGALLAVPGITLLQTEDEFQTLVETYADGGPDAVTAALSEAFDVPIGPSAIVDEAKLRAVLSPAGSGGASGTTSASIEEEAASLSQVVRGLVGEYSADGGSEAWDGLGLGGHEVADFLRAVESDALSMADNVWTVGVLTGNVVTGDGFYYLEPDLQTARELLIVDVEATTVSVEIKDGAGVEGAARLAGGLLEEAGFVLSPMGYAEGYPGVDATQVLASAGALEDAKQVVDILGIGEIVQDNEVGADLVIVILGSDFDVSPGPTTTEPIG